LKISIGNVVLALAAPCLLAVGCSFSYSSKSISDSVSASGKSFSDSSESSSPAGEGGRSAALYQEDVRDFTAAYARGDGDVAGLQRGLAAVARRHGVSDWESAPATWVAVGEGLRQAASSPRATALGDALAGDDAERRRDIERGYDGRV
jgi:hypothetical protein